MTADPEIENYSGGVYARLAQMVSQGDLQDDASQMRVARKFDLLLEDLSTRHIASKSSALGWLFGTKARRLVPGIYLHGPVGRGKTMLMDIFFDALPLAKKRRVHFHEFMTDVHHRIHAHRQKVKLGETRQLDPVPPVAASLFTESQILCFDEFSVTDIADAMILSRLFAELFSLGGVLVATSNIEPDDLYKDGLNRSLFAPFITLLKTHVRVVCLETPLDYRLENLGGLPKWIWPLGVDARRAMDKAWIKATAGLSEHPDTMTVAGRVLSLPRIAGKMARFSFAELCQVALGAADYLEMAARFDMIFIEDIPQLTPAMRNETKRFINLIDTLYDRDVAIFATAASAPEALLTARKGVQGFEFDRTVSRLTEMTGEDQSEKNPKSHNILL